MLQVTSCVVLQWTHLFFPVTLAVITAHTAQAKASDQHSDSSPLALAGAGEAQRAGDTSCPTLDPLGAQISHQMSADTISTTQIVNAKDPHDQLHSQS